MFLIRPVREDDLDRLMELLDAPNYGLTSLPRDRKVLGEKILGSVDAFALKRHKPMGQIYFFVMEDYETGKIAGTSAIYSKVGGFEPFYSYKIKTTVHHSEALNIHKEIPTLHLDMEYNGPSEIGSLYLSPQYRQSGIGRLLSLSRFLFMAKNRECFEDIVLAEMRGIVDERGYSPFWEAVGRNFFDIDYIQADYLVNNNKKFIEELMPRYPLYIPLLPHEARAVIGNVHNESKPALKILEGEGFTFNNSVDIFEAGVIVSCELNKIRSVRNLKDGKIIDILDRMPDSPDYILAADFNNMRACQAAVRETPDGIVISEETSRVLNLDIHSEVCYVELRP